jgi:hypothetical protein
MRRSRPAEILAVGSSGLTCYIVADDEGTITERLSLDPLILALQRQGQYVSQVEGRGFESHRPLQIQE